MRWLEKRSLNRSDAVVILRERQKPFFVNELKVPTSKISVIPNGIDTNIFKPLNIPKKNQIIFVGRGTVPKGLDILLEAADYINADLLIVTQKIDQHLLDIAKSKPNVRVKFHSTPQELVKLYSESKVFTLPSLDEEQPLTVMEAMACGLPVVVTKVAAADLVINGRNGIVIERHEAYVLQQALEHMLSSEDKIKQFGSINNRFIEKNYSINRVTKDYENLYLKISKSTKSTHIQW
jgi:glycosyltransferase involved in cell wall biosynthesis